MLGIFTYCGRARLFDDGEQHHYQGRCRQLTSLRFETAATAERRA